MSSDVTYLNTLTSSCDVRCQRNIVCTDFIMPTESENIRKTTAFGSQELLDGKGMYYY